MLGSKVIGFLRITRFVITVLIRSYYIESANQQWWKSVPPFLSTGHCESNGARSCTHVRKTIPIPLVPKFNTFIVPSINIESISPTMKRCRLSSFLIVLSSPWSPCMKRLSFFHLSFFQFSLHTFFASTKVCMSPQDTNFA